MKPTKINKQKRLFKKKLKKIWAVNWTNGKRNKDLNEEIANKKNSRTESKTCTRYFPYLFPCQWIGVSTVIFTKRDSALLPE